MAKTYYMRFGSGDPRTYTGLAPTFLIFSQNGTPVTPPSVSEAPASSGIYSFTWGTTTPIAFLADAATTSPGTVGRYVTGALDPADRIDEVGTTLVAIGTSSIALGTTGVALGTTGVAIGTSGIALGTTILASIPLGTSFSALGNTLVALGTTAVALGVTGVAIGTTTQAIATSLLAQGNTNFSFLASIGSTASSFGTDVVDPVDLFGYLKRIRENLEGNQTFIKQAGTLTILSRGSSVLLATKNIANSVSTVIKT